MRGLDAAEALVRLAREHPLAFAKATMPGYDPQPFHARIAETLRQVEAGELRRLMIAMPPRYGKSELCAVRFPAWVLGRHPDWRLIQASHSTNLAEWFGRKARNLLMSPEYRVIFPGVEVAQDTKAAGEWNIQDHEGGYYAAGVGAGITGRGADIAIIDDPIADREQANSQVMRDKVWDWYTDVLLTRLQGMRAVILIMTRWHEDDLAGRLLEQARTCARCERKVHDHDDSLHPFSPLGEQWELVSFPALTESGALWPKMHDVPELEAMKASRPRTFAALYQQSPSPDEGNLFKREWFQHRYKKLPPDDTDADGNSRTTRWTVIQTVDTAFKTGVGNDYSVIATWGTDGIDYYVIDVWRRRVEYPELRRQIIERAVAFRPRAIFVEDSAAGQSVVQDLKRNTSLPIIADKPLGSKEDRADAAAPVFEAGKVYLPEKAPWVEDFIAEHLVFPNGAHDDMVDTTSMAVGRLAVRQPQERRTVYLGVVDTDPDRKKKDEPEPFPAALGPMLRVR